MSMNFAEEGAVVSAGLLVDTQVLLWYASNSMLLGTATRSLLFRNSERLFFSIESIRQIAIKSSLGKPDFAYQPREVYELSVESGWRELALRPEHVFALASLPFLHRDPFGRMLVAQAQIERLTLLKADGTLQQYPVSLVRA